jgi:hypothetical protein
MTCPLSYPARGFKNSPCNGTPSPSGLQSGPRGSTALATLTLLAESYTRRVAGKCPGRPGGQFDRKPPVGVRCHRPKGRAGAAGHPENTRLGSGRWPHLQLGIVLRYLAGHGHICTSTTGGGSLTERRADPPVVWLSKPVLLGIRSHNL